MTGASSENRRRPDVRQVARCRGCGHDREGRTHLESMTFGAMPIGRAIHFCDECLANVAAAERPLEAVIADLVRQ